MVHDASPLIDLAGIVKTYGAPQPLRIKRLVADAGDRLAVTGLDVAAGETLIHLITGASVPDEGTVRVAGHDTRAIATDTEWLTSLDRFGIVTPRAVLMGMLPIAANLALPLTLSIDPMTDETRAAVEALADRVGLARDRLPAPGSSLTPAETARVHLARALALGPELLLLEHATSTIAKAQERAEFGRVLSAATTGSRCGWLAITDDREFIRASGATVLKVKPNGDVAREGFVSRLLGS